MENFTRIIIESAYGSNYVIPFILLNNFRRSLIKDDKDVFNEKFGKFIHPDSQLHTIFMDNEIYLKIN